MARSHRFAARPDPEVRVTALLEVTAGILASVALAAGVPALPTLPERRRPQR